MFSFPEEWRSWERAKLGKPAGLRHGAAAGPRPKQKRGHFTVYKAPACLSFPPLTFAMTLRAPEVVLWDVPILQLRRLKPREGRCPRSCSRERDWGGEASGRARVPVNIQSQRVCEPPCGPLSRPSLRPDLLLSAEMAAGILFLFGD